MAEVITDNHEEILSWADKFAGSPQLIVDATTKEAIGLRIDFPGDKDDAYLSDTHPVKNTTWDGFFIQFERLHLAFSYDNSIPNPTDPSTLYKFVPRNVILEEE